MKIYMVIFGVLLSVTGEAAQVEALPPSQAAYLAGIEQFEHGQLRAAAESFSYAINLAPEPETSTGEYLPYIYLSVSRFEMGETRAARDALIKSQVFGVATNTKTGRHLLDQYASEIMSAPLDESVMLASPQPGTVDIPSLDTVISDSDKDLVRSDTIVTHPDSDEVILLRDDIELNNTKVLKRCALSSSREDNKHPWFFHYQCGVALMRAGDAKRAVDSFMMGANAVEDPRRGKRMYGMWYVDYLPYYQIALAHSQLGDWESARAAIKTSENHGEFSPSDPDYEAFSELDQLIKSNLKNNDS